MSKSKLEAKILEVLRRVEWVGEPPFCPLCTRWRWHIHGHRQGCKLDALLNEVEHEQEQAGEEVA